MIRRFGFWLVLPITLTMIWALVPSPPEHDRATSELVDTTGKIPNPWFFMERAYPYGRIPIHRWREAQRQAVALRNVEGATAAAWIPRGPNNIGGRITDIAVDPTDADIVYAGAAEGGVLRSTDGGQNWTPLFDDMPSPGHRRAGHRSGRTRNVVYAGTGEVNPGGGSVAYGGAGLFRSLDQGDTWQSIGLENSGSIGRIRRRSRPTPTASSWRPWASSGQADPERGVYRTTDGGATWERVLYVERRHRLRRPDPATRTIPTCSSRPCGSASASPSTTTTAAPAARSIAATDGGDNWSLVGGGLPAPSTERRPHRPQPVREPARRDARRLRRPHRLLRRALPLDRRRRTGRAPTTTGLANVFSSYGWWFGNVRTHPTDPDIDLSCSASTSTAAPTAAPPTVNASGGMHVDHHGLDFGPALESGDLQRQRRRRLPLDQRRRDTGASCPICRSPRSTAWPSTPATRTPSTSAPRTTAPAAP